MLQQCLTGCCLVYSPCPSLHSEILLVVVRSNVKKYGIDAVLTPAVKDLKFLGTTMSYMKINFIPLMCIPQLIFDRVGRVGAMIFKFRGDD